MWSSVVSHNFLFVVVGWVLFVTLFPQILLREAAVPA